MTTDAGNRWMASSPMSGMSPSDSAPPASAEASDNGIRQLSPVAVAAVWAAAALPMAAMSWLVAPRLAAGFSGAGHIPMVKALFACLTVGLVWQFVLVVVLVRREQHSLRWSVVRRALWLGSPRSPRTGRVGGRTWLVVIPLLVAFAAEGLIPTIAIPAGRDLGALLGSEEGQSFLSGNWPWFALMVMSMVFNTVLGEELLFRGYLLPRMNGAFGRFDWLANGVLFGVYHLHVPWAIPGALLDAFILAYPAKRYRSAWIGIVVHSSQTVVLGAIVLVLVV